MKKYQSIICLVAAVCLLGTAAFSIYHIYDHYEQLDEQTEVFDEIAEVVAQAPDEEPVPDDVPVSEGQDVLSKYKELYLQNEDMVGWISISGTSINYPVMQTKDEPNYYLKHNFEKTVICLPVTISSFTDTTSAETACLELWRIINPRAFMRNTKPFSLIP